MRYRISQNRWKRREHISLVVPRAGVEPGTYEDVITYSSEEGVQVSYTARMTVEEAETTEDIQEQPQEGQEETGGEQDTPQDEAAGSGDRYGVSHL